MFFLQFLYQISQFGKSTLYIKFFIYMIFLLIVLSIAFQVKTSFYTKFYKQAAQILQGMTLEQKIGQTIEVDASALIQNNITSNQTLVKYSIGGVYLGDNCPHQDGNLLPVWDMNLQQLQNAYSQVHLSNFQKLTQKLNYDLRISTKNNTTYQIKPFLGTDAVHGDQRITGNVLFPQNIGLSCTHNPQNYHKMGLWTAKSMKKYGFNWAHAPTVAVSHNPQWGRFFQSMGQDHEIIFQFGKAFTEGIQGQPGTFRGVLASVKHFFSDGATYYGANQGSAKVGSFRHFIYHNIQGFNGSIRSGIGSVMPSYSSINFLPLHEGSYIESILKDELQFDGFVISDDGAVNFCALQGLPTFLGHMGKNQSTATMISSGVDMFMIEGKASMFEYMNNVHIGIQNGTIAIERLNDAVTKIIAVKIAFGLVEPTKNHHKTKQNKTLNPNLVSQPLQNQKINLTSDQYTDSLKAVHQSLVLLKNDNLIPVQEQKLQFLVLVGEDIIQLNEQNKTRLYLNYDNVGMQCGGWSVRWQGFNGNGVWSNINKNKSNASSILDALKHKNKKYKVLFPNYTDLDNPTLISSAREQFIKKLDQLQPQMNAQNTLILGVLGQAPYAQSPGDVNIPYCQDPIHFDRKGCLWFPNFCTPSKQKSTLQIQFNEFQNSLIQKIKNAHKEIPLITVLFSGRPMIINEALSQSQAFISAFLPGTSGGHGVVDAIFGQYSFRADSENHRVNTLSFDWPRNMESLKDFPYYTADGQIPRIPSPLFAAGYGLGQNNKKIQSEE